MRKILVWIVIVLLVGFSVWSLVDGISLIKEGRDMDNVAPEMLLVSGIAATAFGSLLCISAAVIPLARARGWFGGRRQRSRIAKGWAERRWRYTRNAVGSQRRRVGRDVHPSLFQADPPLV